MTNYIFPLAQYTETQHYHNPGLWGGIDIAAPAGTPVHAIAEGIVTRIGAAGFGPYYVEISHPSGVTSYYGHNSAAYVKVGDHVTAGQTIAAVGTLGISTGPHVHFGVRVNGRDVDPDAFMKGSIKPMGGGDPAADTGGSLDALTAPINAVGDLLKFVSDPHNWLRVAEFVGGALLLIGGLLSIMETPPGDATQSVKSAIKTTGKETGDAVKHPAKAASETKDAILDQVGELKGGQKMTVREALKGTKATTGDVAKDVTAASKG